MCEREREKERVNEDACDLLLDRIFQKCGEGKRAEVKCALA